MSTQAAPTLDCACGHRIPIEGRRIGDGVTCDACGAYRVVLRSRVRGEVPPAAARAGGLTAAEREEVAEALRRIKLRRVGHAARHLELYPSWAVFVAGLQFYLSAVLAGQNLIALGQEARGRRLQVFGVASYVVLGLLLLGAAFFAPQVPFPALAAVASLIPLAFATYFTWVQHAPASAAREAGARKASVVLPLLFGLILAIAQAFALWFLRIRLEGPFLGA
ncbi:MAG: hypothetical protein D6731_16615 [Planctomycetota bacterium]|nr:MAG: hypothetical protein D6731_16615 [Planctomycetota bacterium]